LSAAGKGFGQDLVEKLVGDGLVEIRKTISESGNALKSALNEFLSIHNDAEDERAAENELRDVGFRLEQFDHHGIKDKLEKQVAFNDDIEFCQGVDKRVEAWILALEAAASEAGESVGEIQLPASKHNAPLFKKYETKLGEVKQTIGQATKLAESARVIQAELVKLRQEIEATRNSLKEEFAESERQLVKGLEKQGITSIEPGAYVQLTQRKSALEKQISELKKKTSKEKSKRNAMLTAVAELNNAWHGEFRQIAGALAKINAAQPSLKVVSTFKGDKVAFMAKMEEIFRGHNIRKDTYAVLVQNYEDFASIYKDIDKASGHAKGKAETFKQVFVENLFDLLSFQVPNSYDVAYHGKPLKSHSLGQRASAMMLFLLSQEENDLLLIDQPEDDLDSQTVYEEVVKLVRKIKTRQQFIFATHNANFPVLGDAELVAACHADEDAIVVENGSIDTKVCQAKIVSIMEGGAEAFERRKIIYTAWKRSHE
jgi:hypothetical protein